MKPWHLCLIFTHKSHPRAVSNSILVGAPLVGALVRAAKGTHKGCPYKPQTVPRPLEAEMWER